MKPGRSLEAQQVARVYRALADEHVDNRTKDDGEALWARVAARRASLALVPPTASPRWTGWAAAAATCLVLVGSTAFLWRGGPQALEFEVSGAEKSGQFVATEASPATLSFSDRSRVVLEPHTALRVEIVEDARVVGYLSQGAIEVSVHHGPDTDYRFHAGPFEVQVIGTVFRLVFDPEEQSLELSVNEGRVQVRDGRREVLVDAGERRSFIAERSKPAARAPGEAAKTGQRAAVSLDEIGRLAAEAERPSEESSRAGSTATPRAPAASPHFAKLAASGRFDEVVRLAEARGIERVLAEKSPEELHELAQAARYTGRGELAERVWRHLWSRASGRSVGVDASFFLGRFADQGGRSAEALQWFRAYLAKAPQGTYAAESMGRELLIVQRNQGDAAARLVARRYLARFPTGAYAAQARALLSEPE